MMYLVPVLKANNNNYEREPVIYNPSMWPGNTLPKNSKAMSDKLVCVTNRIRATGICVLITHADLHEVFSPFGPIASINIIRNKFRHRNGIAFITYFHTVHAQRVLQVSTPIYLKGNRIYTHQAIQKPRNVNYVVKPIDDRRSTQALLFKNEECKNLLLQKDDDGAISNPTCSSIDSNTNKPLDVQQCMKSSCTNYSSTETSPTIRNDNKSLCSEESKELPEISKGSELKIQNSKELNRGSICKILSGVYPVAQSFSDNQASTNYGTYGINQTTHQLPYHGRVSSHQNINYSYGSCECFLPKTDVSYNPFYVNNHMYQKDFGSKDNPKASESKNKQFHQFNSKLYDYPPVVSESKFNNGAQKSDLSCYKKQSFASQQMKSQANVIHENKMKDRSFGSINTTNVSDKQSIAHISTSNNKVDVSLNDISEEPYSPSSFQKYADSFVESARQLAAFEEQFADAPYEFLQPEEDDEPTEYSKLQSRLLRYNSKRNTSDSNDSLTFSDSDDGITVEIEQFQDYGKYFKMSQSDTRKDSASSQCKEIVIEQSTSLNEEVSHLDKSSDLSSNQLNLLETTEAVLEQSTSLNKEVSHLDKSEDLSICTSNQLNLLETTEAVFEQSTSLSKEVSHLDKSEDLSICTSNQLKLLETTEAVIEQSTSLNKEVSHLDESEEIKPKVSDEAKEKDAILELSIKSGYYLVRVRDVATQFPEYDKNLSKTSTAKVDEPSSINMETLSFTTIDKDEVFSFTSTSVPSVKNKKIPRTRSKNQRSQ